MKSKIITILAIATIMLTGCGANRSIEKKLADMPHKAMLLDEVKGLGITLDTLEAIYPTGLTSLGDSVPPEYSIAWRSFLQDMVGAVNKAGVTNSETYRLWGRVYIAPDGTINHFFYRWLGEKQPNDEWNSQFRQALESFLRTYRYKFTMKKRFAQCGSVTMQAKK